MPAKRGGRVEFQGHPGVITSARGQYLNVRLDTGQRVICHPTWDMTYAAAPSPLPSTDRSDP